MSKSILTLSNVSVRRGKALILSNITAKFQGGQIAAVIGANGTGKSTLLSAVAGQLAYEGDILWCGHPVSASTTAFMPQAAEVHSQLTALDAVLLGRFDQLGWRVSSEDVTAAYDVLGTLGLDGLAHRGLSTLSGGQRQLVLLAQRLMRQPQLLILDEATSALDLRHQMEVLGHLRAYVLRTGALVLIAIHDINLAARQADTFTLLASGTILSAGSAASVLTQENLATAFHVKTEIMTAPSGHRVIVPICSLSDSADNASMPLPAA